MGLVPEELAERLRKNKEAEKKKKDKTKPENPTSDNRNNKEE